MRRVNNRAFIGRLSLQSLAAQRARNIIAVFAVALTTLLFTALFTIAGSILRSYEENTFRQVGGMEHAGFKYLTKEEADGLKDDPLMKAWGMRHFLGMAAEEALHKNHVEVSYADENLARWMFLAPDAGRYPAEGTDEAAADRAVLKLLGVEPVPGTPFSLTIDVGGHLTTQTFTLSGCWDYDEAIVANHVLLPESRVEAILAETGFDPALSGDNITGTWNLDFMLESARHIERDVADILKRHGYQTDDRSQENYIASGINWAYVGARIWNTLDTQTALSIIALLLLIAATGALIIYNIFRISVAGDIRFYGLLKTVGTTSAQLGGIIRRQALVLSLIGIPAGLFAGWFAGAGLLPIVTSNLNGISARASISPWIFTLSALFSLATVLFSAARPGRIAGRTAPLEALRYQEAPDGAKSRSRTVLTVLSLSLASFLFTATVSFTGGFDMDKYLSQFVSTDFVLADAGHFNSAVFRLFSADTALEEEAIDAVLSQGTEAGGRVYGQTSWVREFVTEAWYRENVLWYERDEAAVEEILAEVERDDEGRCVVPAQLYGMEDFALDHVKVLEGDLSPLHDPEEKVLAAVMTEDDYGNAYMDSHWARLGDTVKLRFIDEYVYIDETTGKVLEGVTDEADITVPYDMKGIRWHEEEYRVAALVAVPYALSYRYYGRDQFVLNAGRFIADTGTADVMLYAFDVDDAMEPAMEEFLRTYTTGRGSRYDYESRMTKAADFAGFRQMFLLLGGAMSFIVGLVGALNFLNAVLTGIAARRRELAILEAIGMTERQLRRKLIGEGVFYALSATGLVLGMTALLSPLLSAGMERFLWFFTGRVRFWPIVALLPVYLLLGVLLPTLVFRAQRRHTVVERLREAEE